jgi:hypothetical protein
LAGGGRDWEDLHLGDVVHFDVPTTDGQDEPLTFTIERIRTYGHHLDFLSGGMTGDLFVRGQHGDLVPKGGILYVLE